MKTEIKKYYDADAGFNGSPMNQSNLQTAEEIKRILLMIEQMSDPGSYEKAIVDMKRLAGEALKHLAAMESYTSQSLPQQPVSAGLRWVKASERIAQIAKQVNIKVDGKPGYGEFHKQGEFTYLNYQVNGGFGTILEEQFEIIFWLDENN